MRLPRKRKTIDVKLVRKVLTHVEADLRRLEMGAYVDIKNTWLGIDRQYSKSWPECNTKACMAGWTVLLKTPRHSWPKTRVEEELFWDKAHKAAERLLGFTADESRWVFAGKAMYGDSPKRQLVLLKEALNDVFERRGIPDRV